MKKIVNIAMVIMMTLTAQAQKVTFYSEAFEAGVRHHIGINTSEDVLMAQTDTITSLNLSGMSITDIRDAVYLTAVTSLDLSYNKITDVSPLLQLEKLRTLNLSNNLLESINILALQQAEELEVDVTNNYIRDFSYFYSTTYCNFTIYGMGMQLTKEAPYFEVNHFYAIVSDGQPMVSYQGYTNMTATAYLKSGSSQESAQFDGHTHLATVPGNPKEGAEVILTNGEKSERTYVVPAAKFTAEAGETVTMETGLPEDYTLTSAYASEGTVEIEGKTLKYTAPANKVADVVNFSYYQGMTIKGFSCFYLNHNSQGGDVNGDGKVTITDVVMIISHILGEQQATGIDPTAADVNGDGQVTIADAVQALGMISNP